MPADPVRTRLDLGRIVMVPVVVIMLLLVLPALINRSGESMLRWLGALLAVAFYSLMIWCYLRRGPALATTRSITARVAAIIATWTAFAIPLVHGGPPPEIQQGISDVLLLAGTAWSVFSLRFLGRNLSLIAQARDVVDRGPYRWIRHPLYAGEIVSSLGLAVDARSVTAAAIWLGLCGLQAYRALREEQLLLAALPGYRAYRARTAALLPGIF